jgi:hypothetical protein
LLYEILLFMLVSVSGGKIKNMTAMTRHSGPAAGSCQVPRSSLGQGVVRAKSGSKATPGQRKSPVLDLVISSFLAFGEPAAAGFHHFQSDVA